MGPTQAGSQRHFRGVSNFGETGFVLALNAAIVGSTDAGATMELEFRGLTVTFGGDGPTRTQQAAVEMQLHDPSTECSYWVAVKAFAPAHEAGTLGSMRQAAADKAIVALEAALALLKARSVNEIKEEQWQAEEKEAAAG